MIVNEALVVLQKRFVELLIIEQDINMGLIKADLQMVEIKIKEVTNAIKLIDENASNNQ
jgi:hypothetical protein